VKRVEGHSQEGKGFVAVGRGSRGAKDA